MNEMLKLTVLAAPVECYVMQGEHPLPPPVIEKFAKTGGALNKNVFLLRMLCCVLCGSHPLAQTGCTDKSGVMTTAHGLRIACLGGIYEANMYAGGEMLHVRYGFVSLDHQYLNCACVRRASSHHTLQVKPWTS